MNKMKNSIKTKATSLMVLLVSVFLLSALAGVGKVSAAGPYDWPMFRHDLQNTGYSESPAPNTNQTLWNYTTANLVASSPTVADGKVYVGSNDNKLYCLNALNGAFIWSYRTNGPIHSSPSVANGVVYIGSFDTKVYAFSSGPPIPESLTLETMLLLSTVAVIASIRYFRKRPKWEKW
jgi:hypothetical protein